MKVQLWKIAHARSGDKADRADIGLFAFDAPTYEVLKREVTKERLAAHFAGMGTGMIGFAWPEAYAKCEKSAQIIGTLVKERGWAVEDTNVEYIGYNSLLGANADPAYRDQLNECFLRMTIRTQDRKVADAFGRLFPWLGLSGPPYVGSMKGIQPAKELLGIWPALISRELVEKNIKIEVENI